MNIAGVPLTLTCTSSNAGEKDMTKDERERFEMLVKKLERADGKLWKAVFNFLDAGPEYLLTLDGEGVDVDGLDVRIRNYDEFSTRGTPSKDQPVIDWIKTILVPMLPNATALNQSVEFIWKNKKHRLMSNNAIFRRVSRDQGLWKSVHKSRRSKIEVRAMTKFLKDKGRNYIQGEQDFVELEARKKEALKREGLDP
jgi:hypothetical protein